MAHGWSDTTNWTWEPQPAPEFAMIPGIVRKHLLRLLSNAEFKVLFCLMDDAYRPGRSTAIVSLRGLAKECDLAVRTVVNALRSLEGHRLIEPCGIRSAGSQHPASYRVLVTQDKRYVNRSTGDLRSAGGGDLRSAPLVISDHQSAPSVLLSIYKRKEEDAHTHAKKYSRGTYAVCEGCGCLPCGCAAVAR